MQLSVLDWSSPGLPVAGSADAAVRLALLGPFQISASSEVDLRSRKAMALIGYLALAEGAAASREKLAGLLWGGSPDEQARSSLRQCLNEINRSFGDLGPIAEADRLEVRLRIDRVSVDALDVRQLATDGEPEKKRQVGKLYRGELLDGFGPIDQGFDAWLEEERVHWRAMIEDTLDRLLKAELEAAESSAALETARALLRLDAAREDVHRIVMRLQAETGNRTLALRQYETCRRALQSTFGAPPSVETERLADFIRHYPMEPAASSHAHRSEHSVADAPAEGTSVAVMPFRQVNPDGESAFDETLSLDIPAALSRFRWLTVKPRSSTSVYRDRPAVEAGRRLGVRYVLDGVIRRYQARLRVSVELLDVARSKTLWAEHFDSDPSDPFRAEEELTSKIAAQLVSLLRVAEFNRVRQRRAETLGAHDCLMRAVPLLFRVSKESFDECTALLRRALELDPEHPLAYAWLAFADMVGLAQGWIPDRVGGMEEAERLAHAARDLDPDEDLALTISAHVASFLHHDFERARRLFDRALQLNPYAPFTWAMSAATRCYAGDPDTGLAELERYQQLSPFDPYPSIVTPIFAIAYVMAGRYEEAVDWGHKALAVGSNFEGAYKPLICALGHLGRSREATPLVDRLLELEPQFSIATFRERYPMARASDREHYIEGLRRAGVPATPSARPAGPHEFASQPGRGE